MYVVFLLTPIFGRHHEGLSQWNININECLTCLKINSKQAFNQSKSIQIKNNKSNNNNKKQNCYMSIFDWTVLKSFR